jgi:hypothetical protein
MSDEPKYPDIEIEEIDLNGPQGNAFAIMGVVKAAVKEQDKENFTEIFCHWQAQAMSGSYSDLLKSVKEWFTWDQDISQYIE